MQPRPPRLPRRVLAALDGTNWKLEHGRRHWRLLIDGKQVCVFGVNFSQYEGASEHITAALIRRFKRRQTA